MAILIGRSVFVAKGPEDMLGKRVLDDVQRHNENLPGTQVFSILVVTISARYWEAVEFAATIHQGDVRKGTQIPYLSHLLQVSGLVLEFGGDEEEAIGGLLHDAAEDEGGEPTLHAIRARFGSRIETIVRENSDSITETKEGKAPWRERKKKYIEGIAAKSTSAVLVSICDKIHNARSLASDSRILGESHWDRFNASKEESLWYYASLVAAFAQRENDDPRLVAANAVLRRDVDAIP